ncbi:hypothetical protein JK359_16235 [Streptomyces actinomycinicus]|uniref:Guanylate cyclase domain-containing protein n=1 Tax=Streptomyces actinomycinicus TaxID=1695166 RepID=A0A937JQJ3_9ACTN|nr:hypothetical protein [Streptomyces actinomycinicus]MBL1083503.1 hypothetical protein [Streptomyces actinomycinicus]
MAVRFSPGGPEVLIDAAMQGTRTTPLHGTLLPEAPEGEKPAPTAIPGDHRIRLAFCVDVTGYSARPVARQGQVQWRLAGLVRHLLQAVRADLGRTDIQPGGDGMNVVLPPETECVDALPRLMTGAARLLSQNNRVHSDRLRLRMAWDIGPVSRAALGFAGPLLVRLSRLVDCDQLRAAAKADAQADLVVAVSDWLHENVFRPGYTDIDADDFTKVIAVNRDYRAAAWLWTGNGSAPEPPARGESASG